jgi:tight adherence protein B
MDKGTLIIFLVLVFGSVLLFSQFILSAAFSSGRQEKRLIEKRIGTLIEEPEHVQRTSLIRERYLKQLSPFEKKLEALPGMVNLERFIEHTGHAFPAYRLALHSLLMMLAGAAAGLPTHNLAVAVIAAAISGCIPALRLRRAASKRMTRLEEQLPDALDMMTRALRAGYPFNDAMHYIATEMDDPIATEFRTVFDEINCGLDTREALRNMISRNPGSVSLNAIVTSVLVQRETGGNLAETFTNIGKLIRGRFKFQRRVLTLTAEARLSTIVMTAMPFVVFALLAMVSPGYVMVLVHDPLGHKLIYAGFGLLFVGNIWLKLLAVEV